MVMFVHYNGRQTLVVYMCVLFKYSVSKGVDMPLVSGISKSIIVIPTLSC